MDFRWTGFSPVFVLLIPAFSLLCTPPKFTLKLQRAENAPLPPAASRFARCAGNSKLQSPSSKQITNSNFRNGFVWNFGFWLFGYCLEFGFWNLELPDAAHRAWGSEDSIFDRMINQLPRHYDRSRVLSSPGRLYRLPRPTATRQRKFQAPSTPSSEAELLRRTGEANPPSLFELRRVLLAFIPAASCGVFGEGE